LPQEAADHVADDGLRADEAMIADQDRARIFDCLQQLDPRTAGSIRAAFFDGLTYADLAEKAAVPLGTMKTWVRRGLLRLKDCIGDG
ncbi:MAG: sigma factor-like helix-turn-helix DNA-binding protein, partial [Sphingobium sp.]